MWLLSLKGCFWVLEQPMSSLLQMHPRFVQFKRSIMRTVFSADVQCCVVMKSVSLYIEAVCHFPHHQGPHHDGGLWSPQSQSHLALFQQTLDLASYCSCLNKNKPYLKLDYVFALKCYINCSLAEARKFKTKSVIKRHQLTKK